MKVRKSARIVVLDPAGAVLLVRHQDPTSVDPRAPELLTYWVPPGGGVDEGAPTNGPPSASSKRKRVPRFRESGRRSGPVNEI
jgi:8-oxo-dGTP pyrophosphatase MutT (NUDIX family)